MRKCIGGIVIMYIVNKDQKSGLYYVHAEGFPYVPCSGTFCKKKSEAREYAKMYNGLPHKVNKIEEKRRALRDG